MAETLTFQTAFNNTWALTINSEVMGILPVSVMCLMLYVDQ